MYRSLFSVLCCAVLCCAVLCCAVLCCAVLCCAVLCCAVLCCAVLCCAGSRSSPLAFAAASHPRSQLTVAIDERSLGFWALGYGRANPTGAALLSRDEKQNMLLVARSFCVPTARVGVLRHARVYVCDISAPMVGTSGLLLIGAGH
jgi:hypothetical protein